MPDINAIIKRASDLDASDIHLVCGTPIRMRINGQLQMMDDHPLTDEECTDIARQLAGHRFEEIRDIGELDMSGTFSDRRIRINLFHQQGHISAALRLLATKIPALSQLGLPEVVNTFKNYDKGIVLVTGETGSGKSTTLAALINAINHTRTEHIITLEDPIEYVYTSDKCLINQREVGTDTRSYADGLRAILREDPDVILIGEMRDAETIETALTAAETGHLVFSTLHTNGAVDSVDRIVAAFPEAKQEQIRLQLSQTLKATLSQQLLPRADGFGRVAACECMINTPAIANLIREGKTPQMTSIMLTNSQYGSVTMDNFLLKLVSQGAIDRKTARDAANDPEFIKKHLM
jgi:twitching motility protein PilT